MKKINKFNYKRIFAIQKDLEQICLKACPKLTHNSGIYFYTRDDYVEGKCCYIGKSCDLLKRCASHLQGWQRIDISLRKRGFYSKDNELGWKLNCLYFPENKLDEKESYYIKAYLDAGYELYNIESGGSTGKTMINERKPEKGYLDGLKQGRKNVVKDLKHIIDLYLNISLKKDGVLAQKALAKFWKILDNRQEGENEE